MVHASGVEVSRVVDASGVAPRVLHRQRLVLVLCALVLYHQRLEGPLQQHVELQQRLVKASGVASWLLHRQKLVLEIRLELLAGVVEPSGVPVVAHLLQCCYHHKRLVLGRSNMWRCNDGW